MLYCITLEKIFSVLKDKYYCKINYKYIPIPINKNLNDTSNNQNKNLIICLSKNFTSYDDNEKINIMTWYVKNWSWIIGANEQTINEYTFLHEDDLIARKSKGLSSLSKALLIINPRKISIYDAIFASALNFFSNNQRCWSKILFSAPI